jgi:hypothetical protein
VDFIERPHVGIQPRKLRRNQLFAEIPTFLILLKVQGRDSDDHGMRPPC